MSSSTTKQFGTDDIGIKKIDGKQAKEVTNDEWKKVLPGIVYHVTREAGTEMPGSGGFDQHFEKGVYKCICCGIELFSSDEKYSAGCGWPAFSRSIGNDANIIRLEDRSHGRIRTEVRCKNCDAHLGHVFNDGKPEAGGERYCINSVCMAFDKNTA